ncbi:Kazal-type serine protease inhibitor family protein [Phyllobacterium leguminum]|uniref:Kazal-type serine protease inhibitor-like protein n=1 Tax=Phyllobacterium leguminum TaxID=314237 RepID=A0A318SYR5_9HYPH|nr:Kazal-type serine protease inhibitor [Phyllobacterium leguminum]PYE86512.1 Kazal-type serine protease inhibitor-like protein [Phyllobacterium leguminum]
MTIICRKMTSLGALAALLLTGCVGAEERDRTDSWTGGQTMCPMIYAPVCGKRGGVRQTFGNACQAGAKGFRVVRRGGCDERPSSGIPNWPPVAGIGPVLPSQLRRSARPAFCTDEYAPVCARRGRSVKTFPNACYAKRDSARIVANGPCR